MTPELIKIRDELAFKQGTNDYDETLGFPSEKEWVALKSNYAFRHGFNAAVPIVRQQVIDEVLGLLRSEQAKEYWNVKDGIGYEIVPSGWADWLSKELKK